MPTSQNTTQSGSAAQDPKQSGTQSGQASKPAPSSSTSGNSSSGNSSSGTQEKKSPVDGPGEEVYEHVRKAVMDW